jgi:RNA polymerase sigma-54 factor
MALKQTLSQKLDQRLSPQQIQLMKLLQVPTVELDQRIKQEIEENPALEEGKEEATEDFSEEQEYEDETLSEAEKEIDINDYINDDDPDYKTQVNNKSKDDEEKFTPLSQGASFQDKLLEQIGLLDLSEKEIVIAETIIGNLDEDGYLNRDLESLIDDLAFSQNIMCDSKEVGFVLSQVQSLDPAGIAARDLRECLLLQLKRKQDGNITLYTAMKVVEDFFEEFTKKHYQKITAKLEIDDEDLKDAVAEIIRLNPKPGGSIRESSSEVQQIIPDFMLFEHEGKLELSLNGRNAPDLKVSKGYEQMLRRYAEGAKTSKADKEAVLFVKQKLDAAKWFIDAIKQRQNTLFYTMNAIMEYQKEFFLTGDETNLRPMILKDIAEMINLDISTVSRVANSKYVQTNYGVFPLKYFFSESLTTDTGEEVSTREVKKILSEAIEAESKRKPLPDDKLAELLREKGYNIARRTVAKYREQLNIPVARLRKEL